MSETLAVYKVNGVTRVIPEGRCIKVTPQAVYHLLDKKRPKQPGAKGLQDGKDRRR